MKYFLDTEFIEGKQKVLFGSSKPTIDLISIGIKCEDGREYYAVSNEFNTKEAWNRFQYETRELSPIKCRQFGLSWAVAKMAIENLIPKKVYWLRDNVCKNIFNNNIYSNYTEINTYSEFNNLVHHLGKSNEQIAKDIIEFTCEINTNNGSRPEFYGYYADYDWVVFCWLFGRMIDLPEGFPMYCIDLKQTLDIKQSNYNVFREKYKRHELLINEIPYASTREKIEFLPDYPNQANEHNALADARWNYELYKFLNKI